MTTKNIAILVVFLALIAGGAFSYSKNKAGAPIKEPVVEEGGRVASSTDGQESGGKLKVGNFSGTLESVNEGCYVDGECYVVVSGKHVTAVLGWRQEVVGSVLGVESFGDLNSHIGDTVEVYAQDKGDGTYTLYGSEGFYIKVK